jgi:serine/threonine protein kinase
VRWRLEKLTYSTQNILIHSQPPRPWHVKLGDFGISKRIEVTISAPSTIRGTPGFMAPELLDLVEADAATEDFATDSWALGVTVL